MIREHHFVQLPISGDTRKSSKEQWGMATCLEPFKGSGQPPGLLSEYNTPSLLQVNIILGQRWANRFAHGHPAHLQPKASNPECTFSISVVASRQVMDKHIRAWLHQLNRMAWNCKTCTKWTYANCPLEPAMPFSHFSTQRGISCHGRWTSEHLMLQTVASLSTPLFCPSGGLLFKLSSDQCHAHPYWHSIPTSNGNRGNFSLMVGWCSDEAFQWQTLSWPSCHDSLPVVVQYFLHPPCYVSNRDEPDTPVWDPHLKKLQKSSPIYNILPALVTNMQLHSGFLLA